MTDELPDDSKGWSVGDNQEVLVTPDFVSNVAHYAMERAREDLAQAKDMEGGLAIVYRAIVLETVHQLAQDGFCACHWHRSPIDEVFKGVCQYCEQPEAAHESVRCCRARIDSPLVTPSN